MVKHKYDSVSKGRGVWLTIWLSFMLLGSLFSAISNFFLGGIISQASPVFPLWVYLFFGIASLLNVVFIAYLFMWKRWAFFAMLVTAIIVFATNLYIGVPLLLAALGFLGILVLYISMRSRWKLFN